MKTEIKVYETKLPDVQNGTGIKYSDVQNEMGFKYSLTGLHYRHVCHNGVNKNATIKIK